MVRTSWVRGLYSTVLGLMNGRAAIWRSVELSMTGPHDLGLLGGELACAGVLAGGVLLHVGPAGERRHPHAGEELAGAGRQGARAGEQLAGEGGPADDGPLGEPFEGGPGCVRIAGADGGLDEVGEHLRAEVRRVVPCSRSWLGSVAGCLAKLCCAWPSSSSPAAQVPSASRPDDLSNSDGPAASRPAAASRRIGEAAW